MFEVGHVYIYNYLWLREHSLGEESGRKSRPTCLVLKGRQGDGRLILLAITSKAQAKSRQSILIPTPECKRCNLQAPAWLILDEFNIARSVALHDFESTTALGQFSKAFLAEIVSRFGVMLRANETKAVART